jgi:glycosyltransferase involved in cell wall biosynthesis
MVVTMAMDSTRIVYASGDRSPMPTAAFISTDYAMHHDPPVANGCTWMRCVLPAKALAGIGWDVAVGLPRDHPEMGIGVAHEDGALFGFDVYSYKLLLHQSVPDEFVRMRNRGQRVVVDVDDFHFGISDENIASKVTSPLHSPDNNRMWHEMSMRLADRVIVSTDFLASHYERRCRDVVVVRNALDTERYEPVRHPVKPVIGWVGGTLWRSGDIETLRAWLPGFVDDYGLQVHHSGHIPGDPSHFAVRAGLRRVGTTLNTDMQGYPGLLAGFHVGLVPLVPSPFNEAKSCLKGLEYAAAGIPFIASPTEEYRMLYAAGVGRLAETPDEWRDHAIELLDRDTRIAEAERQRRIVQDRFDIATMGEAWATALLG